MNGIFTVSGNKFIKLIFCKTGLITVGNYTEKVAFKSPRNKKFATEKLLKNYSPIRLIFQQFDKFNFLKYNSIEIFDRFSTNFSLTGANYGTEALS